MHARRVRPPRITSRFYHRRRVPLLADTPPTQPLREQCEDFPSPFDKSPQQRCSRGMSPCFAITRGVVSTPEQNSPTPASFATPVPAKRGAKSPYDLPHLSELP